MLMRGHVVYVRGVPDSRTQKCSAPITVVFKFFVSVFPVSPTGEIVARLKVYMAPHISGKLMDQLHHLHRLHDGPDDVAVIATEHQLRSATKRSANSNRTRATKITHAVFNRHVAVYIFHALLQLFLVHCGFQEMVTFPAGLLAVIGYDAPGVTVTQEYVAGLAGPPGFPAFAEVGLFPRPPPPPPAP